MEGRETTLTRKHLYVVPSMWTGLTTWVIGRWGEEAPSGGEPTPSTTVYTSTTTTSLHVLKQKTPNSVLILFSFLMG